MATLTNVLIRIGLLCAALFLTAQVNAAESIRIAVFEYPPIYQNAPEKGLANEIAAAAFEAEGITSEFRFFSPARMVQAVSMGETACALGGRILFDAPELRPKLAQGPIILNVLQGFIYDKRKFPLGLDYTQLKEMSRHTIGVLFASGTMRYLEAQQIPLSTSSSHAASARQLEAGWIDAWAIVDLTGRLHMKKLFPESAAHFISTPPFNRGDVSLFCSTQRDPEQTLIRQFRQGLEKIQRNGRYLAIMAHYYEGKENIPQAALPDDYAGPPLRTIHKTVLRPIKP